MVVSYMNDTTLINYNEYNMEKLSSRVLPKTEDSFA